MLESNCFDLHAISRSLFCLIVLCHSSLSDYCLHLHMGTSRDLLTRRTGTLTSFFVSYQRISR